MLDKILLVEDDVSTSNYIYHKLEQLDCDVLAKTNNGAEAIKMAKDLKPNLILLDINLPDETDGIETASQILSFLDVPVVYITANSDKKTIKRLMKAEPNAFIIKPFDDKILRSAIDIAVYRHQVKKELLETKEMLRTTIESIDDILITFDRNGFLTYVHKNHKNDIPFIISSEPILKHYTEVLSQQIVKKLDVCFDDLLRTKNVQEFEVELKENNTQKWYYAKASLRYGIDNKILGITLLVSDVSKQKKIEKELIQYSEKLSEVQELAQLGTCEIDFLGNNKLTHNGIFFKILDIDDFIEIKTFDDQKILNAIHSEDKEKYIKCYKDAFSKKSEKFSISYRITDKSNNVKHIHSVNKVEYDNHENPAILLITIQDVSWQKHNQEYWKDSFNERKTAEIKQQFFSNVSFQLRTPLTEILGMTDLLSNTELDIKQNEFLLTIRNSTEKLINMIGDILDVSKIKAGKMNLNPVAYDIRKNVENIASSLQKYADEKNLELKYFIDDKIPEMLYVDDKRVNQVICNLLLNGLKFTSEGSVSINAKVDTIEEEDLIIYVEVQDTGVGIRKEDQPYLFEAFQKTSLGAISSSLGSGLGLYICKNLVDLLEGEIDLESEYGKGSTFWFKFKTKKYTGSLKDKSDEIQQETVSDDLNLSVLLVEDNEENQKVLSVMLESIGCQVKVASNGKEALELYQETVVNAFSIFENVSYDLIIMDMYMPTMNGVDATEKMRKKYDELPPIIGLSASILDENTENFEELGFDDYLVKPLEINTLAKKLSYWKKMINNKNVKTGLISDESFIASLENSAVLNESTINNIIKRSGCDVNNINNLLNSFIEDMDNYYHEIVNAIQNDDLQSVKQVIVAIKGLSATIGASHVHEISKRMEYYAEEENYEHLKDLFPVMVDKYKIFKQHFENKYL